MHTPSLAARIPIAVTVMVLCGPFPGQRLDGDVRSLAESTPDTLSSETDTDEDEGLPPVHWETGQPSEHRTETAMEEQTATGQK
jgi:hypothetical protein